MNNHPEQNPTKAELENSDKLYQLVLTHPSYKQLNEQLIQMEQKAEENRHNWMSVQAELENLKRRTERDIANIHKYAIEKFAHDLLEIVDNLERCLATKPKENELLKDFYLGVELTLKSLLEILEKYQIKGIDPFGEEFNPEQHTAITIKEGTSDEPSNTILEVIQKGYSIKDRLLRPALVVVAR